MTGADVCKKAADLLNSGKYVYWYGGKGQLCTFSLLSTLSALYPSIYTTAYKAKCRQHIAAGKYCIDCSGYVSKCYNWAPLGTYGIKQKCKEWTGTPKDGMIVWRTGHCGIYYGGKIYEARGINYGITNTRTYKKKDWTYVLYSPSVKYEEVDLEKVAEDIIAGKYGNGKARAAALKRAGYTAAQIKEAQKIVNKKMAGN